MMKKAQFLPVTKKEMKNKGWTNLDVILISGDAYIDSPHIGIAVIGRVLEEAGYKVGIIPQPQLDKPDDICRLGEPALFWGISGGCMDSMVANYTATRKFRKKDDLTPGGINTKRPDRAVLKYANLIRRYFKQTVPLVLGGLEASLRRIAHYDYWDNRIRNPLLFDAKADILVYGMGEKTILQLCERLREKKDFRDVKGICYLSHEPVEDYLRLPSVEEVKANQDAFTAMFHTFYHNSSSPESTGLIQQMGTRFLIHNPPQDYLTTQELDRVHSLPYLYDAHPDAKAAGAVKALETIRFSLTTHRGCYGECNFCSISVHQGRTIRNRSEESILKEARRLSSLPDFKGNILDVGGGTANMYRMDCKLKQNGKPCRHKRCLYPEVCSQLLLDHTPQIQLLRALKNIPGIKKVFVASGIRHDLILADKKAGEAYLKNLLHYHTSGQLKIAPEHASPVVLALMGKPPVSLAKTFQKLVHRINHSLGKKQFLTCYFIAAHPGSTDREARVLKEYIRKTLGYKPEQIQIFTPTPSTYSTLMYYTGKNPFSGDSIFIEKNNDLKDRGKRMLQR